MKALIETKKWSCWLLVTSYWLATSWTVQGETCPSDGWPPTEERILCGVICPADISVNAGPFWCTVVVNYTVTVTDPGSCTGGAYQTVGLPSGSDFPVGSTLNTFSVDSPSGTQSCSFTITVNDVTPPSIYVCGDPDCDPPVSKCPLDIFVNTDPGVCTANVTWDEPTIKDNCGVTTLDISHLSGSTFPVGTTVVSYFVADAAGNSDACTFNVTVQDITPPEISSCFDPLCNFQLPGCPFSLFVNNDPGLCTAVVSWDPVIVQDNCPGATIGGSHAPGSVFPTGFTTVTYTATDAAGNTSSCTFDVFVDDIEPPVLTCPDITVSTDPGVCEAIVNFAPTATDNCGIASVTSIPSSGSVFGVGTTNVSVTAVDNTGIPAFCNFTLTVEDNEAPVITACPSNISVNNDPGFCDAFVTWTPPTATDNCTFANIVGSHAAGNTFPLGTTTVTYTADDFSGNTSTCTFDVTVTDNEAPVLIFCPADVTITTNPGVCDGTYTWTPPFVSDNCGIPNVTSTYNPGDIFNPGTTAVIYTATDAAGNVGTCTFNVTVDDFEAPTILNCPINIVTTTDPGICTAIVNWIVPTVTDNCGIASFTSNNNPGDSFPTGGTFTVIYTATDNAGLVTNCFFDVMVIDNEAPVMTGCPANINTTTSATFGICAGIVSWTDPTFTDNCGIGLSGSSHINGGFFTPGTTTVTIFASDFSGNTTNCIFNITIVDDESPQIIPCPSNYIVDADPGVCSAVVSWPPFSVFENCGVFTTTSTHNPGDVFPTGTTTVTFTATDDAGLSSSCVFDVIVSDNEAPAITGCPANITVPVNTSDCSAVVTWTPPTATDNCTLGSFIATAMPGSIFPDGSTTVTYTALDASGNSTQCAFVVTVLNGAFTTNLTENICQGGSFTVGNQGFNQTGNYQVILTANNGCDSTVNLNLTLLPTFTTNLTESICEGSSFTIGNQSFNQTGNYQVVLTANNGCDSTVNLNLTVLPTLTTNLNESICQGSSFTVGNQGFNQTGNYSVTLSAFGGCDSIVNLNLTVLPTLITNLTESICQGGSFTVGNQSFSQTGNYQVILTANNGCDSTVNLNLTLLPTFTTNLTESICEGSSFTIGNQGFSQTGTYQVILTAANGCDSTVNLNLTVLPTFTTNLNENICQGSSFIVGNQSFSQTGNYQVILTAANGCDSTVNLDLTMLPTFTTNLNESICEGSSFTVGNQSFNQTGNYQVVLTATNGCDSTVNLNLTVLPTFTTNLTESICQGSSFTIGNQSFNQTGNYSVTLSAFGGCDSIVNLNLTVLPTLITNLTESICQGGSFTVGNQSFSQTGNYQVILTANNGCDSTVNLNLTVLPTFTTNLNESICQGGSFTIGNQSFSQTGNYQVILTANNGCDSTVNLDLTVLPTFTTNLTESICQGSSYTVGNQSFNQTGNYQVILTANNGCDSTVNLNLTVLPTFTTNLNESICQGGSFTIGNQGFNQTGNYSVTLSAFGGCDSIVNLNLTVYQNPNAMIFGPKSVCLGLSILLSAGVFDTYAWSPGGETSSSIPVTTGGSYTVTVTDSNGCTASASTNIAEEICNSVVAAFSISQDTACASHFVQFNNASIGNSSLLWNFGNGNFSSEPNPSAFYPEPGTYTVTLIAGNGAIADTARQQVYVYPKIEAAFFTVTADICQPKSLIFNDNSLSTFGLTGWSWNFGDGAAANSAIAKHDYTNFDTVNVTHVIFDKFGCTDSINQDVIVTDAGTTPSPVHLCLNLCEGDSIVVENTVFNASNPAGSMTLTTASGCDSTVTVELTFQPLKQTALVPDFSICENESATLNAGSGTSYLWSNGATSQTIVVTPASPGTYEVTVSNSNECPEVRTVSISVDEIPGEDAAAGTDISVCETTKIVALAAQPPASATGSWTTLTDAEINNTANPVSTVSNLSTGENYFIWTLNNGACKGFSADTVVVRVIAEATEVAQAGDDQSFCSSVTSIQLASTPPQGTGITGTWSQPSSQEQLGVQIAEPGNPHSPVAGFYPNNTYLFTWTLTNGACGAYSFDNVLVSTYAGLLPPADAGDDLNLCTGVETTLKGNLPPGTIGEWAALDSASDAFISQPFNASTLVSDLAAGGNAFVWTLSGNDCPSYSSDTVQVFLSEGLVANEDVYFNLGQPLTRLDFLANDEIPDRRNVTLTFLSTPLYGSLRANANDTYDFTFGVDTTENIEFTYEICLKDCPDVCDQAQVLILSKSPLPPPAIRKPANVITPNGDATGERFAIPNYSDIPPPIEMTVINRWGNVVFHEKDYQNDWNGKSQRGKQLPDGTYYYILKGGGSEVSGSVTIVR